MTDNWKVTDRALYLQLSLRFFDEGDKTEKATPKKRQKARSEGQVAKSQEVGTAFLLLAAFFTLKTFAPYMYGSLEKVLIYNFGLIGSIDDVYEIDFMSRLVSYMFSLSIMAALPLMLVTLSIGIIANFIQVGWHPTLKPLMPKFSKLNPIKGFKRLLSFRAIMDLFKSLSKFALIIYVIYSIIRKEIDHIPLLMELDIVESAMYIGQLIANMGINIGALFLFVALADYSYTRYKHEKDLRMSKHEVKEEYKQAEGNPQIRGKIKQKMREISMRRMMQDVPKADVIITNPQHYAVALHYDREKSKAPVVVAKGADFLAKRIKEMAKEHGVEIVENVQLARTLYATVDVGQEIPPELFQAVAEVLAFVYKLKAG